MDNMVNFSALSGKRILVTGDTGFKGSWLCLWLNMLGAEVFGFALPPEREIDHFNLLGLANLIKHTSGDIRSCSSVQEVFERSRPEILFHLAAQPLVRYSYTEPKLTFDTNIAGSVNILEASRQCESLRAVVFITSDKCYRNKEWVWGYREVDELGGHDPYSASKAAAELVFSSYQDSFFSSRPNFGAASVRAGNVIGGGDWAPDRIVPDAIRALKVGEPIRLRNPQSTRPWQHVLEPLSGYLTIATKLLDEPKGFIGPWNFGPQGGSIRTVKDLAESVAMQWGNGRVLVAQDANALHEAGLLHLNCDKANQFLGWHPRWDFDRTIAETVTWYREITSGAMARDVSSRQICSYMGC